MLFKKKFDNIWDILTRHGDSIYSLKSKVKVFMEVVYSYSSEVDKVRSDVSKLRDEVNKLKRETSIEKLKDNVLNNYVSLFNRDAVGFATYQISLPGVGVVDIMASSEVRPDQIIMVTNDPKSLVEEYHKATALKQHFDKLVGGSGMSIAPSSEHLLDATRYAYYTAKAPEVRSLTFKDIEISKLKAQLSARNEAYNDLKDNYTYECDRNKSLMKKNDSLTKELIDMEALNNSLFNDNQRLLEDKLKLIDRSEFLEKCLREYRFGMPPIGSLGLI